MPFIIFGSVLLVIGIILFFVGKSKSKLKAEMEAKETTEINDLREGQHAEIKGKATCDNPLTAPGSNLPCIYYSYTIQRRERRTRTSSSGTRSSSYHWRTIDSGSAHVPFKLTDQSGEVTVDPEGASIDAPEVVDRYIEPGENMDDGFLKSAVQVLSMFGGERRRIEVDAITGGQVLYVLGNVKGGGGSLRIAKGEGKFFISTKSEEQLMKSLGWQSIAFYGFGILLAIGGVILLVMRLTQT